MGAKGFEPILKHSRWCLLKRPGEPDRTAEHQTADLVRYNLRTVRSFLLKEDFQFFRQYKSPQWAGRFMDDWCSRTMRSKIEPMKKVARVLRSHRELLLNWFRAKKEISAGVVEGFNNKPD
jgi:transposase